MPTTVQPVWPFWIAIALALGAACIPFASADQTAYLLGENGPVELTTALLYLVSAALAAVALVRSTGVVRLYALFWLLLSVFCFGEETSWLQHEIGFATPADLKAVNVQGEFNLHNLQCLHGGKLLGTDAVSPAFGALLSAQNLFQLGFAAFFLAIPALALAPPVHSLLERLRFPYPGGRMALLVWLPILGAVLSSVLTAGHAKDLAAEVREMFYAMGFALFTDAFARHAAWFGRARPAAAVAAATVERESVGPLVEKR